MDGMKFPEPGDFVESSMEAVLDQVGKEHDLKKLEHKRLAGDYPAKATCSFGLCEENNRRGEREVRHGLNKIGRASRRERV